MLQTSCSILPILMRWRRADAGCHTSRTVGQSQLKECAMTILEPYTSAPANGPARPEFARLIEQRAPVNGRQSTAWPGLEIVREDHPIARTPVVYEPCLCVIAQGCKRAYLGNEAFTYDPLHYLVVAVPLPIESEVVEASPDQPYLALRLRLQAATISDLLLEIGDDAGPHGNGAPQRGIYISPVSDALYGALLRLVGALDHPADRRVLAPMAEREVLYHLLVGEQGEQLRAVALRDSHAHRIARVLRYLQMHYDQPLDIATIAEVASMSPSTLHHTFRDVTNSSPLQYLKQIRLHQARLLMLHDGLGAGEAAHRVGYGSDSQFSREYRRLFGVPPSLDVAALRTDAIPITGP
jgi:AraC-like DNA-binding protein